MDACLEKAFEGLKQSSFIDVPVADEVVVWTNVDVDAKVEL